MIDEHRLKTVEDIEAVTLIGCTLHECFKRLVLDDHLTQRLIEDAFNRFPSWRFNLLSYDTLEYDDWPVRFENWTNSTFIICRFKESASTSDWRHPELQPPVEVVAVRRRLEEQFRRLITWLREGALHADGIREPKDHALTRLPISKHWWSQLEVEISARNSNMMNHNGVEYAKVFSDIRITPPNEEIQAMSEPPIAGISSVEVTKPLAWGAGELEVWEFLKQKHKDDPNYPGTRMNASIGREIEKLPEFHHYETSTLIAYVGRARKDLKI